MEKALRPIFTVSKTLVDFGRILVGDASEETISIRNDGEAPLVLEAMVSFEPPFSLASDSCSGQTLNPNASCSIGVKCSPVLQGSFHFSFDVSSNDPDEHRVKVDLTGKGVLYLIEPEEGTIGSEIELSGSGFGTKKGRVLLGTIPL